MYRENGGVETMNYAARFMRTGLRDCTRRDPDTTIRRTCIGEIKDNAKKKIRWRIARGVECGETTRSGEKERKR